MRHEGYSQTVYKDSLGVLTVGYGRNLEGNGVSELEARFLLVGDITRCVGELKKAFPWFELMDEVRQDTLVCLCFNLGLTRLMGFKRMIGACVAKDWDKAAAEMLNSKWASQVGVRAVELSFMMRTGQYLP